MNKDIMKNGKLGLQARNAEGCMIDFNFFLVGCVWSMVAAEDGESPVGNALDDCLDVLLGAQRRVHFEV